MCRVICEAVEEGQLMRSKKGSSEKSETTPEPQKEVEQEEAQKAAAAAFQERERKIATGIAEGAHDENSDSDRLLLKPVSIEEKPKINQTILQIEHPISLIYIILKLLKVYSF